MESETILLLSLLFGTLIILSLLSLIKVVFGQVADGTLSVTGDTARYLSLRIKALFENPTKVSSTISFSKSVFAATFTVLLFSLFTSLLSIDVFPILLLTILASAILISIPAYAIPRAFGAARSENYLLISYGFYNINSVLFFPFVWLMNGTNKLTLKALGYNEALNFLTKEEKEKFDNAGKTEDALDQDEREMIHNIFEFDNTEVNEIMIPRVDMEALDATTDYQTVLAKVSNIGHSRIPVYEDTIDSVIGILYVKDILNWIAANKDEEWDIRKIMRKPHYVPANKALDDLMTDMKTSRSHIVIIVDEYGGTAGMVTMEDILEEIVGEIHDEHDEPEEPIKKVAERTYLVDPHVELDDLAEAISLPIDLENDEYNTLGGLFYHEFGDVPEQGTLFEFQSLKLTIEKMDNQRIEEIRLELPQDMGTTEVDNSF